MTVSGTQAPKSYPKSIIVIYAISHFFQAKEKQKDWVSLMSIKDPCDFHKHIFHTLITVFLFLIKSWWELLHCHYWSLIAILVSICHKVRVNFKAAVHALERECVHWKLMELIFLLTRIPLKDGWTESKSRIKEYFGLFHSQNHKRNILNFP